MPYANFGTGRSVVSIADPVAYRRHMANLNRQYAARSLAYAPKRYRTRVYKGKKYYRPYK